MLWTTFVEENFLIVKEGSQKPEWVSVYHFILFLETTYRMAMALDAALWIAKMTWIALSGWISSCLTVADEFASSLRSGDIGPFHVG
ncbi:hypothetical protein ACSQ67_001122 [Phaseolus vulgaris]